MEPTFLFLPCQWPPRRTMEGSSHRGKWRDLDPKLRSCVARLAATLWTLPDCTPAVFGLATRWNLGANPGGVATGSGRTRLDRLGAVECRFHQHPRHPACRRSAEKRGSQPQEPADHALGLSRGGFGSKLHVLTDGKGNLLQAILTRGNRNECPVLGPLLGSACCLHKRRPARLAGDKGYSSDVIRDGLVRCGVQPVIPMRENEHVKDRNRWGEFNKSAYKKRNVV